MHIRLLLLLAGLLTLTSRLAAQTPPNWVGAHAAGGLQFDAVGNSYTYGNFTTTTTVSPGVTLTCVGTANGYVAKFDSNGALAWVRQLTGTVTISRLLANNQGNVTLVADYQYSAQLGNLLASTPAGNPAQRGIVVARLDAQGTPLTLWPVVYTIQSRVASGALFGSLTVTDLDLDASGNVYVTNINRGQLLIGTTVVYGSVTVGMNNVILKVSSQGNLEWVRQGGYLSSVAGYDIVFADLQVAPNGDAYFVWDAPCCVGDFDNVVVPRGSTNHAPLIVKYTAQGIVQWAKRFSNPAGNIRHGASTITPDGQMALAVSYPVFTSFDSFSFSTAGYAMVLLSPTNGDATVAFPITAFTGGVADNNNGLTTDASGNLYHVSSLQVASYSPAGRLRWQQAPTAQYTGSLGNSSLLVGDVRVIGSNLFIAGGAKAVTLTFGPSTIVGAATIPTYFVAELGGTTLATRPAVAAAPLLAFPNPAATTDNVTLPTLPKGTQLTILDALGRTVYQQPATNSLPLTQLTTGLYLLRATSLAGEQWQSRLTVK
jgi:hypothetical protein